PRLRTGVDEPRQGTDARRVDHRIDAFEVRRGGGDRGAARLLVRDVALDRERTLACLVDGLRETVLAPGEKRHAPTAAAETRSDAAPETARRTDDHDPQRTRHFGTSPCRVIRCITRFQPW